MFKLQIAQGLVKGEKHATIALSLHLEPCTMREHYKRLCIKLDVKGEDETAVVRRLFELTIEHMQDTHKAQIAALERQIEDLKGQVAGMQPPQPPLDGRVPEDRRLPPSLWTSCQLTEMSIANRLSLPCTFAVY